MRENLHEWRETKERGLWTTGDLHQMTARASRQAGKSANFAMLYGSCSVRTPSRPGPGVPRSRTTVGVDYSALEMRILEGMAGKAWRRVHCGLVVRHEGPPPRRSFGPTKFVRGRHTLIPLQEPSGFPDCYDMVVQDVILS